MSADMAPAAAEAGERRRIGRLERSAIGGVLVREVINYSSFWRSSAFSSIMEPVIYLLAFGFGLGGVVHHLRGFNLSYRYFIATGTVGMSVMYSGAFPSMFSTFVKYKFQRTYDAILAAPVDSEELVTAEALWIACRVGVYGCAPVVVAMVGFGLHPAWGMLVLPLICFLSGLGWSLFGITIAATMNSIDNFSYVMTGFLTPMMLLAGTFFPITQLPHWARILAHANPLYNSVQLVRGAAFGWHGVTDLWSALYLAAWAFVLWRLAIRQMTKRLVD
jgi:lipooligosaccharide transport system permease protein